MTTTTTKKKVEYHDSDYAFRDLESAGSSFLSTLESSVVYNATASVSSKQITPSLPPSPSPPPSINPWDDFHHNHCTAQFFRPKNYVAAEFNNAIEMLNDGEDRILLEVGCGAGAGECKEITMACYEL